MNDYVNRKNTEIFKVTLDALNIQVANMEEKINNQNNAISTLTQKVAQLEQGMQIARAMSAGHGPSVR